MAKARSVLMLVENQVVPVDPRVWLEARALRDAGFRVSVISPKGTAAYRAPYECIEGIHIYRYRLPAGRTAVAYLAEFAVALAMTFWLSAKVWRRHGVDVIHAGNPPDIFFPIAYVYRLCGAKFVFDQHDLAPELFQVLFARRLPSGVAALLHRLLVFFERCSYRAADLVIVTNDSFRQIAMDRGGCVARKVVVVRNGPDLTRFRPVPPDPALKQGRPYLLAYVGIMGVQDGIEYALRALDVLVHRRGRRDIALVLVGDGAHAPALRTLAHALRLDEYVTFTGWVSPAEVARYLSPADVGLAPEPYNALNNASTMIKTMEYMALGIPVVAFDLKETHYSARGAGRYATPNSIEDLATKVEDVLADDGLRRGMGAEGRKRVEDVLSWKYSAERLLRAYDELCAATPATPVGGRPGGHDRAEDVSALNAAGGGSLAVDRRCDRQRRVRA